jgi:ribosomal protein L13E
MHIAKEATQSSKLKVLKPIWKKLFSKEEIAYEKKRRLGRGTKLYQCNEAVKLLHRLPFHPDS